MADEKKKTPVDAYDGKYKDAAAGKSPDALFGLDANPPQQEKVPAKNLRSAGSGSFSGGGAG